MEEVSCSKGDIAATAANLCKAPKTNGGDIGSMKGHPNLAVAVGLGFTCPGGTDQEMVGHTLAMMVIVWEWLNEMNRERMERGGNESDGAKFSF